MIYLVRATRRHCMETIDDMREADRRELEAAEGDVKIAVLRGWLGSSYCFAARDGRGRTLGLFGVFREDAHWWCPWLIGTSALDECRRDFVRLSAALFPRLLKRFPNMRNYVDARNERSVRWLKRLGFQFGAPEPYGVAGLPFYRFWIGGGDECVIRL
ncbi:MAG: hypothetical protein SOR75_00900 [Synergistes jonesii]|uniref:hypothetical protein n=1 Tax=Synergistes jonesii TaxID=2754 RepID=UPI002A7660AB|nr:hypothetical protein [Synergistes jonesii]MDY2983873.1 hypothetical protein [Synergistes jonesii]